MTTGLLVRDFLDLIIRPTLADLAKAEPRLDSPAAERLLLGTAVYESNLRYMRQRSGPARSLFQIEPATFADVYSWLSYEPAIASAVFKLCLVGRQALDQYAGNQHLACAIARLIYWRVPCPLPDAGDIMGLSRYYKLYYNTSMGAGSPERWVFAYNTECAEVFA